MILDPFYLSGQTPEAVRVADLAIWIKVLEGISAAEVREAWVFHMQNDPPRNARGYLLKPDSAVIYNRVMQLRQRAATLAPKPPKPLQIQRDRPEPASAEARARIMRETFGERATEDGVTYSPKGFPKPPVTPKSHLDQP